MTPESLACLNFAVTRSGSDAVSSDIAVVERSGVSRRLNQWMRFKEAADSKKLIHCSQQLKKEAQSRVPSKVVGV